MSTNMSVIEELFKAQAHLGHKTNRIHPRASKFIYKIENSVSIIDLMKTETGINKVKELLSELGKANKQILVVGTKKIASSLISEICTKYSIPYVAAKWPPGLLTNFESIKKNIKKLQNLKEAQQKGEWEVLTKHEQSQLKREMGKLERVYGGFSKLNALPSLLFVVDVKKEKNAVKEGRQMHIPVAAMVDTNIDPGTVDHSVPANDDSASSIEYILKNILSAYKVEEANKTS